MPFWKTKRSKGVRVTRRVHAMLAQANAARDRADWRAAVEGYCAALEQDPALAHIWDQLGNVLGHTVATELAREPYGVAAALDPGEPGYRASWHRMADADRPSADPRAASAGRLPTLHHDLADLARAIPGRLAEAEAIEAAEREADAALLETVVPVARPVLPGDMSIEAARAMIGQHHWHHSIDFGDGLIAHGGGSLENTRLLGAALFHGIDLHDRSLVDIGAWNGAFSFEAKRRGAARVLATDHYVWNQPAFRGRESFDLARSLTGLEIEAQDIDVPAITPQSVGMFDAVLFSGVFYHLLDPIGLTQQVGECARHMLILETVHDALDQDRPAMIFYPGTTLDGDGSNWWAPNPRCLYEMLSEFGFARILYRDTPRYPRHRRGVYQAFRDDRSMAAMGAGAPMPGWFDLSREADRRVVFAPLR